MDQFDDDLTEADYFLKREAEERAAAEAAACMARTAHEDMAELYAEKAEEARRAETDQG